MEDVVRTWGFIKSFSHNLTKKDWGEDLQIFQIFLPDVISDSMGYL